MKIACGAVTGLIASLVLFVSFAFAQQQSGSQQNQQSEPGMQQSQGGSRSQQGAMMQDPETIKQVQQALSNQGFDTGTADGKMGSKTKAAIKKYQKSKGMQASGKLDQETLASLGVTGGSAAGGQQGGMQDQQSGAGGQQGDMQDQQSGAGGQQQSSQQSGAKY